MRAEYEVEALMGRKAGRAAPPATWCARKGYGGEDGTATRANARVRCTIGIEPRHVRIAGRPRQG